MKTYIGSIAWRSLHPAHVFCLMELLARPNLLWGPITGDALVERSRGRAATAFLLHSDADVMVSVDSDIVFRPDDLLTIARQAHELQAIVGGIYMTRGRNGGIPASTLTLGQRYDFPIGDAAETEPVPINYLAAGFTAVPRSVFATLAEDLPLCHEGSALEHYPFYLPFVLSGEAGPELLSEDYALCERARRAGFPILANTAVRLGHIGEETFWLEEMTRQPTETGQPLAITRTPQGYRVEHRGTPVGAGV